MSTSVKERFIQAVEHGMDLHWNALLARRAGQPGKVNMRAQHEQFSDRAAWLTQLLPEHVSDEQLEEYTKLLGQPEAREAFRRGSVTQLSRILDMWPSKLPSLSAA